MSKNYAALLLTVLLIHGGIGFAQNREQKFRINKTVKQRTIYSFSISREDYFLLLPEYRKSGVYFNSDGQIEFAIKYPDADTSEINFRTLYGFYGENEGENKCIILDSTSIEQIEYYNPSGNLDSIYYFDVVYIANNLKTMPVKVEKYNFETNVLATKTTIDLIKHDTAISKVRTGKGKSMKRDSTIVNTISKEQEIETIYKKGSIEEVVYTNKGMDDKHQSFCQVFYSDFGIKDNFSFHLWGAEYDSDGELIKERSSSSNSSSFKKYAYNNKGLLISYKIYQDNMLEQIELYKYDYY